MNQIKAAYRLSATYSSKRDTLLEALPYHFNVLDEVGVNENAHSKVLGKILKYQRAKRYVHLESFLKYLGLELNVQQPKIHVEKGRIDISIYDKDYAIVIENKIHYAVDQPNQIENYVERVISMGYPRVKIYVLYLTRHGFKTPLETSISKESIENFGDRYIPIDFANNIAPWLKEEVIPLCKESEIDFRQGLQQYINHLDRLLLLKEDKFLEMNQKLTEFLRNELGITDTVKDVEEDQEKIKNKMDELRLCMGHLESMQNGITDKLRKNFLRLLYRNLGSLSPDWECVRRIHNKVTIDEANVNSFGFRIDTLQFRDTQLPFLIEIQDKRKFLCGFHIQDEELKKELIELFTERGIELKSEKGGWIAYDLHKYDYKGKRLAWYVYDIGWNGVFADESEEVAAMFFGEVQKVYSVWKEICAL